MVFPYTFPLTLGPMQVLYPNIIYHPGSGTEIFIDSLQRVDHAADAEVVTYRSSVDGSLRSFTRDVGARQMSLSCKIRQENEQTMRRLLNYLRGEKVYLMLGAESMATAGRIQSFNIPKAVGTYTPLSIEFTCDTDLEGQFHEAESGEILYSASIATDAAASMGSRVSLTGTTGVCRFELVQSDIVLPLGNYTMFVRAKDTNQVTNDLRMSVVNVSDTTSQYATTTVTDEYAIYTLDFEVDSADAGDTISFRANKGSGITNTIYVDFLGFVRTD